LRRQHLSRDSTWCRAGTHKPHGDCGARYHQSPTSSSANGPNRSQPLPDREAPLLLPIKVEGWRHSCGIAAVGSTCSTEQKRTQPSRNLAASVPLLPLAGPMRVVGRIRECKSTPTPRRRRASMSVLTGLATHPLAVAGPPPQGRVADGHDTRSWRGCWFCAFTPAINHVTILSSLTPHHALRD